MVRSRVERVLLVSVVIGVVAACGDAAVSAIDGAADAGPDVVDATPDVADAADPCADAGVPSSTLECAGLYSDFASKTLAKSARAFSPAIPFWSDGAGKERWIELPAGTKIDATNPNEWVFPVGTKLFKQFTYGGRRVETRLFQKVTATYWVHAAYAWNSTETATHLSFGESVPVDGDGGTWVIPTPSDCDSCHRGRNDRVLGFEQVNMGLPAATGLTLEELVAQDLIAPAPARTNLVIGDGTGLDAPALGWLHVNCGVTCHNGNENAQGFGAKMLLRLDPATLDGTPPDPATWDPLRTTIGVPCISGSVAGQPRIVRGSPSSSVIVQLVSERGTLQMPPIATRAVDVADVAVVSEWIRALGADGGADAGRGDGGHKDGGFGGDAGDAADAADASDASDVDADGDADTDAEAGP